MGPICHPSPITLFVLCGRLCPASSVASRGRVLEAHRAALSRVCDQLPAAPVERGTQADRGGEAREQGDYCWCKPASAGLTEAVHYCCCRSSALDGCGDFGRREIHGNIVRLLIREWTVVAISVGRTLVFRLQLKLELTQLCSRSRATLNRAYLQAAVGPRVTRISVVIVGCWKVQCSSCCSVHDKTCFC